MKALMFAENFGVRVKHFFEETRIRRNRRREHAARQRALVTVGPFDREQMVGIARRHLTRQFYQEQAR